MSHPIVEQSSSCDTESHSEPCSARQLTLDVYYTNIYKDPKILNCETQILKKRFFIFRDSYVLAHKQSCKVKIIYRNKQCAKLLHQGFEIITQIIFKKMDNGKYTFTVERKIPNDESHQTVKENVKQSNIHALNSLVFVSVKSQREFSQSQLIKDKAFIKLGKEIYETKIYHQNSDTKSINILESTQKNKIYLDSKENSLECKICLVNQGQSKKDYIVSPCKCAGSCSAVHLECLKNWISQKIEVGKGGQKLRTYDMYRFACEICKEKYPELIQIQNSLINIAPQMKINSDTLVITKVYPVQQDKKYSHFISLEKGKAISIGRHYTNELILEDMSISRTHGAIYRSHDNKSFYIHDKNSRFGTFSSLKSPIHDLKEIILQSSKHIFRFKIFEEDSPKVSFSSNGEDEMTEERIDL